MMRLWIKAFFALAVIALLAVAVFGMGKFALNLLHLYNGGDAAVHDPMFADEEIASTMPPELMSEPSGTAFTDNSANWNTSVQTPVDQTAEELGEELRRESDS